MTQFDIKKFIETSTNNRIKVEFICCPNKTKFYEIHSNNSSDKIVLKLDRDIFSKANSKIAQSLISLCQSNNQIQGLAEKIIAYFIQQHLPFSNKAPKITKSKVIDLYKNAAEIKKVKKDHYDKIPHHKQPYNNFFTSFADIDSELLSLAVDELVAENNAPYYIKDIIMEILIAGENEI